MRGPCALWLHALAWLDRTWDSCVSVISSKACPPCALRGTVHSYGDCGLDPGVHVHHVPSPLTLPWRFSMQFSTVSRCAFPFTEVEVAAHRSGPALEVRVGRGGDPSWFLLPVRFSRWSRLPSVFTTGRWLQRPAPVALSSLFGLEGSRVAVGPGVFDKERPAPLNTDSRPALFLLGHVLRPPAPHGCLGNAEAIPGRELFSRSVGIPLPHAPW